MIRTISRPRPELPPAPRLPASREAQVLKLLLALTLLVALGARVWGANWQLPWLLHPDENYPALAIRMLRSGDLNPHYFQNPSLLAYWLAGQYWLLGALGTAAGLLRAPVDVSTGPDLSTLYLLGRLNSALLGAVTVWAAYALGALILPRSAALLGAVFLALNFLHVRDSHYATNDIAATCLLTLSVLGAARLSQQPAWRTYLLAGLLGGLAAGTKYSGGLFVIPLLVGHLLAWRWRLLAPGALARLLAAGLVALAAFVVSTPFALLDWPTFKGDFLEQYRDGTVAWFGQSADPVPLLYGLTLAQAMGWLQLALAVVGLAALCWHRWRAALLLGGFPAAYLLFMATKALFFVRFALPLLPFLALFAAFGLWTLVRWLVPDRARGTALALAGLVALAQPTLAVVQHNLLISREDTRVLASRWALEHLVGQGLVATDKLALPPPGESWPADVPFEDQDRVFRYDVASYRQRQYRYLVTSSFTLDRYRLPTTAQWAARFKESRRLKWPDEWERAERFEQRERPLATFAPGVDGSPVPFQLDDMYTPFWNLGAWARPGPTIRVYALP